MSAVALELGNARNVSTGVLIGIVVLGVILALFITSLIGRIVILVVVIALGTYVWQQRTSIEHKLSTKKCQLNATFFGIHVKAPPDVVQACLKHTQQH